MGFCIDFLLFILPTSGILSPHLVGSYIEQYVYTVTVSMIILNRQ